MLNFIYATEKDRREAAAIERRRAMEEERKKRIFDPKARISVDYEALREQIQQKQNQKQEERQRDLQYDKLAGQFALVGKTLEEQEKEERKKLAQQINEFRLNFQQLKDRREFDLNDPKNYKTFPARLYDDDPRCGPSSIQKFEGEDLCKKERGVVQRAQLKSWLDQQMEEKEAAEKARIDAENAYKAALMARDQRAIELQNLERECRKRLDRACCEYNKALADERDMKIAQKKKEEEQDCMAHQYNVMMSDMMTETPDGGSALGPNRKSSTGFKGMSAEQKAEFLAALQGQIDEVNMKKLAEKRFNKEWDEYSNGIQKSMGNLDQEIARKQREINKNYLEQNKQLEIEQRNHQQYLKHIVYTNRPTAAYYDQFNKSAR